MRTCIAVIATGALCCAGLLAHAAGAAAETTPNNSGRPLENVQAPPQGAADVGYFVGAGGAAPAVKPTKAKARSARHH